MLSIILTILGIFVLWCGIDGNTPNFHKMIDPNAGVPYVENLSLRTCSDILVAIWRALVVVSAICIFLMAWTRVPNLHEWSTTLWPLIIFSGIFSPLLVFVLLGLGYGGYWIYQIVVRFFKLLYY
jgi:hypothetical protein